MLDTTTPQKDFVSPSDRGSLQDDLQALVDDARSLAEAELAYQKARAAYAGLEVRRMLMLGALAAALVFFTLMAMTLGLVLAFAQSMGPLVATAVVSGGLLIVALCCALLAALRWKRMKATITDKAGD